MPTEFGGCGGIMGGRQVNSLDGFEMAVARVMGERLCAEGPHAAGWTDYGTAALGQRLWGSMANTDWVHENGDRAGYSMRAAGDLIAAVVGQGDYMDWYCSAPEQLDAEVLELLALMGWKPC